MTTLINTTKDKKKKSFFREVQSELKKVSWTSKEELKLCTKIVVLSTFAFGLGIYGIDLVIRGFLHLVSYLAMLITG